MKTSLLYIASMMAMASAMVSCSRSEDPIAKSESKQFCIADSLMPMIQIDTVKSEPVQSELLLTGKISFDEDKVLKVYPLAGGSVQEVHAELGDYVQKGQVLAIIKSADIASVSKDLSTAESNLAIAKKNMDVAEDMYKSGLNSEKDFITAQNEYHKAESELKRVKQVLNIYGASTSTSDYVVKAPISGFIVEKKVNADMQIRPDNSDNLFTISDLKNVWAVASVYESDIAKVRPGYDVSVTTLPYPNTVFKGKIDKTYNVLDPANKAMKVRVRLENPDYLLKPEMFASIRVAYTSDSPMPVIPSQGIIFDNSRNYALVYKNKCDITPKEITLLKDVNGKSYVTSGLEPGDRIITKQQLLIYNALTN